MRTGKKLLTGMLLVLFIVFVAGCGKTAKTNAALPEVRNSGTAIQWKYPAEEEWRDLVALTELRGAAGENGKDGADGKNGVDGKNGTNGKDGINGTDGKNGINGKNGIDGKDGVDGKNGADGKDGKNGADGKDGKDGINGKDGIDGKDGADGKDGIDGKDGVDGINAKNIEVRRAEFYIQWRYEGEEWQNLVAIADIEGPAGQNGTDGANGKTPEFRVSENILQWRYVDDEIWLNLYDLTALKGADGRDGRDGKDGINGQDGRDGADGQNGSDGKDGKTPFIGENGNWWFGEIDTGIKAAGIDGIDGEKGDKGDKGDPGEKGDKGDKGDAGQNGSCSGYFYAETRIPRVFLNNGNAALSVYEKVNSGDLISTYLDKITLKKGHVYSVTISGSLQVVSNESNNSGNYSIQMTDGYDDDLCREVTRIKRDGKKIAQTNDQHSFNFTRIYDASDEDITLYFMFEQSAYNTRLESFKGTITITALD